jgi:hypothetical protein
VIDVGTQVAGLIKEFGKGTDGKTVDYGSPMDNGTTSPASTIPFTRPRRDRARLGASSVAESTKEFGLRMAVGAGPKDIFWQFLVEAVALCLVGGAIEIRRGWGGPWMVCTFLK